MSPANSKKQKVEALDFLYCRVGFYTTLGNPVSKTDTNLTKDRNIVKR